MKKFVLLVIAFVGFACVQTQTMEDADVVEVKPHPLTAIWVDYAKSNPHIFNNQMSRDKAAPIVKQILIDSIANNSDLLKGCPVRFETMLRLPKNKVAVKFSVGDINPSNIAFVEDYMTYDVSMDIFAIVSEDFALKLKDRQMYTLQDFTFEGDVNKKNIILPSGRKLEQTPKIWSSDILDEQRSFSFGGIYLSNMRLTQLKK